MEKLRFAAFIMTFERPNTLRKTVLKLLDQTVPPHFILVVDNSITIKTAEEVEKIKSKSIGYHRVGHNSGPAGAAKIGLEKLSEMGYDWIYWGDDDNPPGNNLVFENLFRKLPAFEKKNINIGIFGGKGGLVNKRTGRVRSLSNEKLAKADVVEVDVVPGGHTMLVKAEVIKEGVLPSPKLFFGFEELDFCLKVKSKGYRIFVDSEGWLRTRYKANNRGNYQWKASRFGDAGNLWRDYYSTRNLLYIFYRHEYYSAFLFTLIKSIAKSLAGFVHGIYFGRKNFQIQWAGCIDFFSGRFGKRF